jgi:hypothetical protein
MDSDTPMLPRSAAALAACLRSSSSSSCWLAWRANAIRCADLPSGAVVTFSVWAACYLTGSSDSLTGAPSAGLW